MSDKKQSYLEPTEEDIDLEKKFRGTDNFKMQKSKEEKTQTEKNNELIFSEKKTAEKQESLAEQENVYDKILSQSSPQDQNSKKNIVNEESVKLDAQTTDTQVDAESKVNHLMELAQNKGIFYAVKVARHLDDNYILDELHDKMLGEKFYQSLIKKGMIKKI